MQNTKLLLKYIFITDLPSTQLLYVVWTYIYVFGFIHSLKAFLILTNTHIYFVTNSFHVIEGMPQKKADK